MAKKKKGKHAATHTKRSRAAKKGWETRRKNQARARKAKPGRKGKRPGRTPGRKAPEKILWRLTVAAPYYVRNRGKKKRKTGSPASAAFIVRAWYTRKLDAVADRHALKEQAEEGRARTVSETKQAYSKNEKPDIEIKAVRYDERLIGIVEETNEP